MTGKLDRSGPAHMDDGLRSLAAEIIDGAEHLAALGLALGGSGNISVRSGNQILISPTGASLGRLRPDGLSTIDLEGNHQHGPKPSKEFGLHAAVYRSRADVNAVVHLHSDAATAVACQRADDPENAIPPLTSYFVMKVGRVPLMEFAPPGSPELAVLVAQLPRSAMAALMANHGSLCLGRDMTDALEVAIELEAAARVHLLSRGPHQVVLRADQISGMGALHPLRWIEEDGFDSKLRSGPVSSLEL